MNNTTMSSTSTPNERCYLFKLMPLLPTPVYIKALIGLPCVPAVHHDEKDPSIRFVEVDAESRQVIKRFLRKSLVPVKGLFISLAGSSRKNLSATEALGCRLATMPCQEEYPIPYFLYDTLADSNRLKEVLRLDKEPVLRIAIVRGGKVIMWRGERCALVDSCRTDVVMGEAYVVRSKEEEDVLRRYMVVHYEVVRCRITTGEEVPGLTFRFCGRLPRN
jgi:hypothetical protein